MKGPFARRRGGGIDVAISEPEAGLLRSVGVQMRDVLVDPHGVPHTRRLFPPAYEDDSEAQAEFAGFTTDELTDGKRRAVGAFLSTLERGKAGRGSWRVSLSAEEAGDWLAVLNDARLTLGTRLDVTEESYERDIDPADPDAAAREVFRYLGWLEEFLVDALMG